MMLITSLVLSVSVCSRLEVRCGKAGVVSGLQAIAQHKHVEPIRSTIK